MKRIHTAVTDNDAYLHRLTTYHTVWHVLTAVCETWCVQVAVLRSSCCVCCYCKSVVTMGIARTSLSVLGMAARTLTSLLKPFLLRVQDLSLEVLLALGTCTSADRRSVTITPMVPLLG